MRKKFNLASCYMQVNQEMKEYQVGHGVRKRDHFARALCRTWGGGSTINFVNPLQIHILSIWGGGEGDWQ